MPITEFTLLHCKATDGRTDTLLKITEPQRHHVNLFESVQCGLWDNELINF